MCKLSYAVVTCHFQLMQFEMYGSKLYHLFMYRALSLRTFCMQKGSGPEFPICIGLFCEKSIVLFAHGELLERPL
jgi:hypothetical protein